MVGKARQIVDIFNFTERISGKNQGFTFFQFATSREGVLLIWPPVGLGRKEEPGQQSTSERVQ